MKPCEDQQKDFWYGYHEYDTIQIDTHHWPEAERILRPLEQGARSCAKHDECNCPAVCEEPVALDSYHSVHQEEHEHCSDMLHRTGRGLLRG